jgi:hypothetical protein
MGVLGRRIKVESFPGQKCKIRSKKDNESKKDWGNGSSDKVPA